jgi:putative ABC transport system permease protein
LLVVSQTTLALCLLIAAGLLLESFWKILNTFPGFNPRKVLVTDIILPSTTYRDSTARYTFLHEITYKIAKLPGVETAGAISEMPMNDEPNDTFFTTPGQSQNGYGKGNEQFRMITPDYFRTMEIPLLRGRSFRETDRQGSAGVMIVDELFAAKYFPHEDAIGKHLLIYEGTPQFVDREIVAIVSPIRTFGLQQAPEPMMYFPYAQSAGTSMHFMIRAQGNLLSLAEPVRRIVAARDPDIAIAGFRTMEQVISQSTASGRFIAVLLSTFAALALGLAMAGVYGVFNYTVVQQTHDFGVRMALGARPRQMLTLILGRGFRLAVYGVLSGSVVAWFLMQMLSKQLYEVKPHEPVIYLGTALLLIAVALGACYLPARRAARLDPMIALRQD